MLGIVSLERRRVVDYLASASLMILGIYLRCFVYLKIEPGAILVYGAILAAGWFFADARKTSRIIGARRHER